MEFKKVKMETEKKSNEVTDQKLNKELTLEHGKVEKAGGPIDLEKAKEWTDNYMRANRGETISHLFGREVIEKILRQKNCAGIRIYYATSEHDRGKRQLILVGTDRFGKDQLPGKKVNANQASGGQEDDESLLALPEEVSHDDFEIFDQSWPCPGTNGCPSNGLSNS